jgi:hypothetical protein
MGYQLTLTPDPSAQDANGRYKFYAQQVIEFTITVTSDSIQDGDPVYVYPVSTGIFDGEGLVLRGYDGYTTADAPDTVSARLTKTDDRTGVAKLRVLVVDAANVGPDPQNVWVSLEQPVDHTGTPALQFARYDGLHRYEGIFRVPRLNSGFTLPVLAADAAAAGPAASCNGYIRYQFEVVDEDGAGLPQMRIMLQGERSGAPLDRVLLYSSWESDAPMVLAETEPGRHDWYADLLTDKDGYAEVYLCAKPGQEAMNWLSATAGQSNLDAAPFVITALTTVDGLDAPSVTSPVPLDRDPTVSVFVDQTFDQDQQIYWYCNGRYQGFTQIGADLEVPRFSLSTAGLYSTDFDQGAKTNDLLYIAPRVTYLGASKRKNFAGTGTPRPAGPPDQPSSPACNLPAPSIAGNPDGWPVNIGMVQDRLRLRIPLSGSPIKTGDLLGFDVYLNGFRLPPDDSEPVGGCMAGPMEFRVTRRMQDLHYAEWLLPPLPMLGYGQMGHQNMVPGSAAQDEDAGPTHQVGDVGTLEVSYQVYPGGTENWALLNLPAPTPIYCSEVLRVGLDTIGPDGGVPTVA